MHTVDATLDAATPCGDALPACATPGGIRTQAFGCLLERDPDRKVEHTRRLAAAWRAGNLPAERDAELPDTLHPGRSVEPGWVPGLVLTAPTKVKRRGLGGTERRASFVHAIAHIEWNAINLAWDAVWRFGWMPHAFVDDWVRVAEEEASHFAMLRRRLQQLGSDYGRLPAHAGLWEAAEATRHDLLARMALVPRVLEARGLDVTPGLAARLRALGDEETASILDVVLREEVGHVRIGSHWFHHACRERGLEPAAAFEQAVRTHFRGRTKGLADPAARQLRLEAGFLPEELEAIERLARSA